MILGTQNRYMIVSDDGKVAVEETGTIYLAKMHETYLTSKVKVYKESKAALKAIERYDHVLKDCKVKSVQIIYEVIE